jgi:hypothetical protein
MMPRAGPLMVSIAINFRLTLLVSPPIWFYNSTDIAPSNTQASAKLMPQLVNVNPTSEHELYLQLFITCGAGS